MRKIVEVLRLHHEGDRSHREIARVVGTSPTTVGEILRRARQCGVAYPVPAGMSEAGLEALLYAPTAPSSQRRPEPDWPGVHRELRRKGVSGVIPCWTQGVQRLRVGGKANLTCPSRTAYGEAGAGGAVPPNATLKFEVHLLEVQ